MGRQVDAQLVDETLFERLADDVAGAHDHDVTQLAVSVGPSLDGSYTWKRTTANVPAIKGGPNE